MKWIRRVLLKIENGHDSVDRLTDGQMDRWTDGVTDKVKPVYPLLSFIEVHDDIQIISLLTSNPVLMAESDAN